MVIKMFKNKTRTFLLLTLIFIAVLGLSTISATDIDDNQTSTVNTYKYTSHSSENNIENEISNKNPEINKNTNNNIKSVDGGTFTDLNTKILENEDITLENDYTKNSDETQITISKKVNINGNGKTIQSDNGLFTISSTGNVTFQNVNFIGGSGSNSAFTVNGILNLINCTFSDHSSNSRAFDVTSGATVTALKSSFNDIESQGAFYLAARTTAEFKDCEFTNCLNTVYGGAITNYRSGTLTVDNCTFTDNTAAQRGGAIYTNGGTLIVKNSTFTGNEVQTTSIGNHQGGKALYVEGEVYLYNNSMTNNRGISADIFNSYATIHTPVTITVNNATCEEGEKVNLTASIVDDNGNTIDLISEPTDITGLEDAVNLTHFNFTIEDNKYNVTREEAVNGIVTRTVSLNLAAGLYEINAEYWTSEFANPTVIPGTLNITETPYYNYAKLQNMIDETSDSTITLDYDVKRGVSESNVNFTKDITIDLDGHTWDATGEQAIEILNNTNVVLKNGIIVNIGNSQPTYTNSYGRLARITKGNLVLENMTITNSSAPDFGSSGSGKGSLIKISTNTVLTVTNSTINDITGRFVIDNDGGIININNSQFNNNKLDQVDSLIEIKGITNIENTVFENNTANWGVIYGNSQKELLTIKNTTFNNNMLSVGAPVVTGDDTNIINSKFFNNKATRMTAKSGAIYTNGGSLTVSNTTFIGNTANGNDGSIIHHTGYFANDLSVTNSILIPADTSAAIYNEVEDDITATANYNYWGTNITPANYVKSGTYEDEYYEEYDCTPIELKYWVVMNTTVTPNEDLKVGEKVTIETTYNTYTDGTNLNTLETSIPDISVEYTTNSGTIDSPVTTQGGQATTEYKITSETTTITATDSYNTNTLELTATTPQIQTITLNDENWTYYFDENDGFVKESVVAPGSELRFEGEFHNRNMFISIPLNLTTADEQAVFYQSSFTILTDDVNITQLKMNGESMDYPLIGLEDASNINIKGNNLTLTNNEDKTITHTIEITGGNNNKIKENTITTTGPEDAITYASNYDIILLYTTSIYSSSDNLIIDNNTIITKSNGQTEEFGTIYGVYIQGNEEKPAENIQVTNNNLNAEANNNVYGLKMDWATKALIENNTVNVTCDNFASAIHLFAIKDSQINNNTVTNNAKTMAYAIVTEGAINIETEKLIIPRNNKITNNTLDINSKYAWAIEAYAGEENNIQNNNINVTADNGMGIGLTDKNTNASYNNIIVTATMNETIKGTFDYINPYTAGIKIVENGLTEVNNNKVTYNNITVTAPNNETGAINITTDSNTITDNYLISPYAKGDKSVINTGSNNIIENNTPNTIQTKINVENITIYVGDEELISFEVYDNEDNEVTTGTVTAYIDNILKHTISLDNDVQAVPVNNLTTGNHTLLLKYEDTNGNYEETEQTSNIEVIKRNYELDVTIDENVIYKDPVQIMGTLYYADEYVTNKDIEIIVNNETITTQTTNEYGEFEYGLTGEIIGENNITIKIKGDDKYNDLTHNLTFNVAKGSITITIEEIGEMLYGEETWIFGEVNEDTGNELDDIELNITINNKTYTTKTNENMFDYMFKSEILGTNNVTVSFAGNDYYNQSSTKITYTVSKLNVLLTLTDINDTKIGQEVTITGELYDERDQPIANQTINIKINDITVTVQTNKDGIYGFVHEADTVGTNNITVNYDGTVGFESAEKETTFNVEKQETKLTLDNINNTKYNQTITITGKLSDITGKALSDESIALLVNDDEITIITDENGLFTYNYTTNTTGINNITADFDDNTNYIGSTDVATFNVSKLATTLSLDPLKDAKLNSVITISGKAVDENDQAIVGQVNLLINNARATLITDNNGKFTYNYTVTRVGVNNITATLKETNNTLSSNATTQVTVTPLNTKITLKPITNVKLGETVTINGQLLDENNKGIYGTIKLLINNAHATVKTDNNGVFTYNYSTSRVGVNNVTVSYLESAKYTASNTTATFNVLQKGTKIVINKIQPVKLGNTATISGQLLDESGKGIYGTVKLLINNGRATVKTDNNGVFTYNYSTSRVGVNNVTISYLESAKYTATNTTATFKVLQKGTKIVINTIKKAKYGETITITGQLLDESGKDIYGTVKLLINGGRATVKTDKDGKFSYNYTTSRVGVNNVTATYLESAKYTANNTTTTFTIEPQSTKLTINPIKTVTAKTNITISGKLSDKNGKGFYGTVKLLINNGRATVKTDTSGLYSYTYTASRVGVNNITASYLGSEKYLETNTTSTFTVQAKTQ